MRHSVLAALAVAFVGAAAATNCGASHCDCGPDTGNPCPGDIPVDHGASCSTEDASACGYAASCSRSDFRTATTCVCRSAHWDCNTAPCPACDDPTIIGAACAEPSTRCAGPTHAVQCDGSVVQQVQGSCTCTATGWFCDGVASVSCEIADAGAD